MPVEKKTNEIRVVSYNILSNALVDESSLPQCDPKHLQEEFRKDLLQKLLEAEVKQRSIICLQEVSTAWAAWLHTWFDCRNYYYINTQWSKHYNDYMGTSIAISKDKFLLDEVRLPHPFRNTYVEKPGLLRTLASMSSKFFIPALVVAPVVACAWKRFGNNSPTSDTFINRSLPFYLAGASFLSAQAVYDTRFPDRGPFHSSILEEGISARHRDVIPMVKLRPRSDTSEAFWVANVHMPCKYWNSKLMTAFACNIANTVQEQAGECRYILAGDFNSRPPTAEEPSGVYEMFVGGELSSDHPHFPVVGEGWEPKLAHPMVSAYKVANGKEPEVTCYCDHGDRGLFANTLDYIWLSPRWNVLSVDPMMELESIKEKWASFPCEVTMSDHLKIGANLKML